MNQLKTESNTMNGPFINSDSEIFSSRKNSNIATDSDSGIERALDVSFIRRKSNENVLGQDF
jgi:hypothetical protein